VITDLDIFGVYLPGLMVMAAAAFLLNLVVRRALGAIGFYRLVWHRSLFDLSLFVIFLGGLTVLFQKYVS
jgi:protein AaeX